MTIYDPDGYIRHISGPEPVEDGLVAGEIELPGGLPPEDDEDHDERFDVRRWDDAFSIADRDGFVLFDPDTPGGFRALTPDERAELSDSVRAGTPPGIVRGPDPFAGPVVEGAETVGQNDAGYRSGDIPDATSGTREQDGSTEIDQAIAYDRVPWTEASTGRSWDSLGVRELPEKPARLDGAGDSDEIARRLDEARVRLTGYTWRDGVDRDEALAERRQQLGRWYSDDTADESTTGEASAGGFVGPEDCLGPDGSSDPRWYW